MIEYIFASVLTFVLGSALVVWLAFQTRGAIRNQRELAAKKGQITSEDELEEFISQVDQALTDEDLNRLAEENKKDELCSS